MRVFPVLLDRLALQEILDDVASIFVPPHVNIFLCFGGLVLTIFSLEIGILAARVVSLHDVHSGWLPGASVMVCCIVLHCWALRIVSGVPDCIPVIGPTVNWTDIRVLTFLGGRNPITASGACFMVYDYQLRYSWIVDQIPVLAQWVQHVHLGIFGGSLPSAIWSYAIYSNESMDIGLMPIQLGTADFMVHHIHAFTIHVTTLISGIMSEAQLFDTAIVSLVIAWLTDVWGTLTADGGVAHITDGNFSRSANTINGWLSGVALAVCTVSFGVTGYSLPYDQVGYGVPDCIPIIGPTLVELIRGGPSVGQATLTRFYSLHTFAILFAALGFIFTHFLLGLSPSLKTQQNKHFSTGKKPSF